MNNEVKVFDDLKVKEIDGKVMFDAEAVAIGLGIVDTSKGYESVRWNRVNNYLKSSAKSGGKIQNGDWITEPQFYKLAIKANSKKAEAFQDWVTEEVLPSIRKNGIYQQHPLDEMGQIALLARGTTQLNERVEKIDNKVDTYIENQVISATDNNVIAKAVSKSVHQYGSLHQIEREARGPLFKDLNGQIKQITGAGNRSRIKSKDYDMVIDFIDNWEPTTATKILLKQEKSA